MIYISRYLRLSDEMVCQTIGHNASEFTDSGYQICKRCGAHAYYDAEKFTYEWHNKISHFLVYLNDLRWFWSWSNIKYQIRYSLRRCKTCGRFNFQNKHNDDCDIPF